MKIGFSEPSGTYNIVLNKKELEELNSGKSICIRPDKLETRYKDDHGICSSECGDLRLSFYGKEDEHFIQFVGIVAEK